METLPGFDVEAGRTWIYPTNFPVRKYQFDIVKTCLFQNTLVRITEAFMDPVLSRILSKIQTVVGESMAEQSKQSHISQIPW